MSNILKVTTPVSGYENNISRQTPSKQMEDMSIKNPVDAQRVTRADGRNETNAEQSVKREVNYDSNFGNFVQSLRELPVLREVMSKLVFSGMAEIVESGIAKGTAEEIQQFLEMLQMSPDELKAFLKSQMNGANRLQGTFFDLLRQVMSEANTVELKSGVLEFLKKYNDMSSGKHLLENIKNNLQEIASQMFRNNREEFQHLTERLLPHSLDNQAANVQTLKESIIPYLSKYVSSTRDMGLLRDLISVLSLNVSRYENGNLDGVIQSFQNLLKFSLFQQKFSGVSTEALRNMFANVDFDLAAGRTEWTDTLLHIMQASIRGEAGVENREAFLNIMNSILINESVYMPVMHVMLPVILNGVPMFSEMWVDPNEESENPGSSARGVKLLIKLDLKDVGFFDMIIYCEDDKVDMLVHYPEELADRESEIRNNIREIMSHNHLDLEYLSVEQGKNSIPVSAVFPKIFERRNSVDVTA